ncbi:MAG: hypothetical protein EYC68_14945 [Chloroflexota bacterium]|nr:MAG: hypothetical protein EYC68_14945 [Chloroflexota bacterium]
MTQYQEFDLPGTGPSLSLDHTYNNQANLSNNIVGYDWIHAQRMYILDNGDNTATLYDADGTQHLFTNGASGTYTAPKGNLDTLTRVSGVNFTLTHPDQSQHLFQQKGGSNWYLTQITNRAGNTISFTYPTASSNKISTITAGGGRTLTFTYNGSKLATVTDNAGHAFGYTYDATTGDLLSIRDPLNYTTTFAYTNHNLTTITDPRGTPTQITFDASNRVKTITVGGTLLATFNYGAGTTSFMDGNNHTTTYAVNSSGQVTQRTDALNKVTTYQYDPRLNLKQLTDPLGRVSKATYNSDGYMLTRTDALNQVTTYTYNTTNDLLTVTDPLGRVTTYTYDADGNVLTVKNALNKKTTYTYNARGQRLTATDANNRTTAFTYNNGHVSRITDPLTHAQTFTYDGVGNRLTAADAAGHVATYTYDANNRLTSVKNALNQTTMYQYDPNGNLVSVTDANGHTTTYVYNNLNRRSNVRDATNATIATYQYDAVGNLTSSQDAGNNQTTYGYDVVNQLATITNPAGKTQTFTYDAVGNPLSAMDEAGQTTSYAYDALNRVSSITDPASQTTTYAYDALSNVKTITDPTGKTITNGYDAVYRLTSRTTPIGANQYAYDNVGNLTTFTDPSGAKSVFTYDAADRLTQRQDLATGGAVADTYTYAYSNDDLVLTQVEARSGQPNRTTSYTHDAAHHLKTTTDPNGGVTTYNYDNAGNRTGVTDPLGVTTESTLNAVDLPTQTTHKVNNVIQDTIANTFDARYNLTSAVTTATNLTLTTAQTFNSNDYLTNINHTTQGSLSGSNGFTVNYTDNNLVATITPGYFAGDYTVKYDSADRVNCFQNGNFLGPVWWAYNADGNRRYSYGGYNPIRACTVTNDPGHWWTAQREEFFYTGQKLTKREWRPYTDSDPGVSLDKVSNYTYDASGNLTQEAHTDYQNSGNNVTRNYGWSWQGGAYRLTSFTQNGVNTTFDYDPQGRIIRRTTAQGYSEYTYEDGTDWLVRETWHAATSGQVFDLFRYWYTNGRPSRVEVANTTGDLQSLNNYSTYYLQYNWHGDVSTSIQPNGDGGNGWSAFDPWGNGTLNSSAIGNYYGWNGGWGYLAFGGLGMYYVHGRWYSPDVGRFISPDEKGEYLYGSGEDAVNYVWAAGQGAICQFVNDEALGEPAAFDQFLQDITNGERVTGYTTLCVENQGGDAFNFGTYFGRGASYAVSVVEIVGGVDMIVGGGIGGAVTCPVTLGGGCVAGAGAVVVGAAGVVHGGAVLVRNLNAPILRAEGTGNDPQNIYPGKTHSPNWPQGFESDHIIRNKVKNPGLLSKLRALTNERDWNKVYENGFLNGRKVSVHYFQSSSGKVFALKIVEGWSSR